MAAVDLTMRRETDPAKSPPIEEYRLPVPGLLRRDPKGPANVRIRLKSVGRSPESPAVATL